MSPHFLVFFFYPILFILAVNEDMHKISDEFKFRPDRTIYYVVSFLEPLKNVPMYNGKMLSASFLIESSSELLETRTGIKARKCLNFGPDQPTHFGVCCP